MQKTPLNLPTTVNTFPQKPVDRNHVSNLPIPPKPPVNFRANVRVAVPAPVPEPPKGIIEKALIAAGLIGN